MKCDRRGACLSVCRDAEEARVYLQMCDQPPCSDVYLAWTTYSTGAAGGAAPPEWVGCIEHLSTDETYRGAREHTEEALKSMRTNIQGTHANIQWGHANNEHTEGRHTNIKVCTRIYRECSRK